MFALAKTGPKNLWAEKIAPTKLKISVSSKYYDIITHGSLAAGGDSCYVSARAKVNPRPWDWEKSHEIGYCYPVGAPGVWGKSHPVKA